MLAAASLSDAESREKPVEHVLHVDPADKPLERDDGHTDILGQQFSLSVARHHRPVKRGNRVGDGNAMAFAGQEGWLARSSR